MISPSIFHAELSYVRRDFYHTEVGANPKGVAKETLFRSQNQSVTLKDVVRYPLSVIRNPV